MAGGVLLDVSLPHIHFTFTPVSIWEFSQIFSFAMLSQGYGAFTINL